MAELSTSFSVLSSSLHEFEASRVSLRSSAVLQIWKSFSRVETIGLFHFYSYRGMEGEFPGGVPQILSKGVRDKNHLSRGLGQFFQRSHTI